MASFVKAFNKEVAIILISFVMGIRDMVIEYSKLVIFQFFMLI